MRREPHENVATVLVHPRVLTDLELSLMAIDLRVWPVHTAPICLDGPREAFQIRRRLLMRRRGEWDHAADWTPVWIAARSLRATASASPASACGRSTANSSPP
ncbi:MAG: hypothetical protein ABIN79_07570, partial [Marmoricola sp.]